MREGRRGGEGGRRGGKEKSTDLNVNLWSSTLAEDEELWKERKITKRNEKMLVKGQAGRKWTPGKKGKM